jgi:anhydro-N-acetylmuramic acid kinase
MDAIGLISGTSMDGIDAVLATIHVGSPGLAIETRDFFVHPYPEPLLADLRRAAGGERLTAGELGRLHVAVGEVFAAAAMKLLARARALHCRVEVIGSHGQTVAHDPEHGVSVQLGSAAVIAERSGLPVVADFRARDLAAGGQGAPLVPYVDRLLFADPARTVAALNLGGIANLTVLPPAAGGMEDTAADRLFAYDIGPANMVIDGLVRELTGGGETFDRDGVRAQRGAVSAVLLEELLADAYFALPPPKSTGSERFGDAYVARLLARGAALGLQPDDLVATATALTVRTVAAAIQASGARRVVSAGGGVRNPALAEGLRQALPEVELTTSAAYGIDPDAKEAIAFAILAWAHLAGVPAGLPPVTGARRATVLGTLTPGAASEAGA